MSGSPARPISGSGCGPGTDGALALGLAHLMIERGWYDRDFIRDWSNGPHLVRADTGRLLTERDLAPAGDAPPVFAWDGAAARLVPMTPRRALRRRQRRCSRSKANTGSPRRSGEVVCHPAFELYARLCRRYPPEVVEAICWIPRAQVEEAARLIWHARPVSYYAWSGHEQHANVTQTARAMSLLYALTGSSTSRGGNVLFRRRRPRRSPAQELPAAQRHGPDAGPRRAPARAGALRATSPPAISTGPFWRGSRTRSAP